MAALPLLFIVLSSTALLLALVALWSSLRQALGAASGEVGPALETTELPDRAALLDEKKSLLRAIKDLEYEHAVGKISPEDFKRLDLAYRIRAKEVLSLLEQDLAPYQARAEDLVAHYVGVKVSDGEVPDVRATAPRKPSEAKSSEAKPTEAKAKDAEVTKDETSDEDREASLRERARALRAEAERLERLAGDTKDEHEIEKKRDDEESAS